MIRRAESPSSDFIRKPRLAFRIGITGARTLTEAAVPVLNQRLREVLGMLRDWFLDLAEQPEAAGLYTAEPALLRMISPLAEGADRLAAAAALELGYRLEAPLPFSPAEYERDFPEAVPEFRALLAAAEPRVLALDGGRGDVETRSYEAVGRLVVRNCDLLIAIWDGGKSGGRGGTAEIVHYAGRHGLPIWWIPADGLGLAGWLAGPEATRHPAASPRGPAALALLESYLRQSVLAGPMSGEPGFGIIGDLVHRLRRHPPLDPLRRMFAERKLPKRLIWSLQSRVMRWAAPVAPAKPLPNAPAEPSEARTYWQQFYEPVDATAIGYAERYRSSYILIFGLAALAACAAILGVGDHQRASISTSFELVLLAGILAVVAVNDYRGWHLRSITYRLLAELFRKQQALALLAWSLPAAEAAAVTGEGETAPVRDVLVGWYFNAAQRAAPLPRGDFGSLALARLQADLRTGLVERQMSYHNLRQDQLERAARRFGKFGAIFFLATLLIVFIKFILEWDIVLFPHASDAPGLDHYSVLAGFVAALLPALSAAFVGIRGYAELELLADQSLQMRRILAHSAARLDHLRLDIPLASQDLAAEILALAQGMLRDVRGWAQLFRVKAVDVG
jgi:hypothetical protein